MSTDLPQMADHPLGDKAARQRRIRSTILLTIPGTFAVVAAAHLLLPPLRGMEEPSARLMLAMRWLPIALLPYVAVCLTISLMRLHEGSHDPMKGAESVRLEIHRRVMQNTLEQFMWFATSALALAALLGPDHARIVPVTCVAFAVARLLYWRGYFLDGTLGRAPAVQMTLALNISMFLAALGLLARSLVAGL